MKTNSQKGFTLIETLVAISILVLAVTGAFAAAQNGISTANFSKDQIVAFYLAEEGVEEIRNVRDQNGLEKSLTGDENISWLKGLSANPSTDPCYFGSSCKIDAVRDEISRCPTQGGCPPLKQDKSSGYYGYDPAWDDSKFTRDIQLVQIVSPDGHPEVSINVTVSWAKGLIQRQFRASESILDWQ